MWGLIVVTSQVDPLTLDHPKGVSAKLEKQNVKLELFPLHLAEVYSKAMHDSVNQNGYAPHNIIYNLIPFLTESLFSTASHGMDKNNESEKADYI